MASTYTPIATYTVSSPGAQYTFSSIPSTYTDLVLIVNGRTDRSGQPTDGLNIKFNTDDGSNYSDTCIYGTGSATGSYRDTNASRWLTFTDNIYGNTATSGLFAPNIIHIQNYANTTTYKTGLCRWTMTGYDVGASVGLWRSTAAINAITLISRNNANFVAGCTFTLYGVKAA